jgi:hypothetical protein
MNNCSDFQDEQGSDPSLLSARLAKGQLDCRFQEVHHGPRLKIDGNRLSEDVGLAKILELNHD